MRHGVERMAGDLLGAIELAEVDQRAGQVREHPAFDVGPPPVVADEPQQLALFGGIVAEQGA